MATDQVDLVFLRQRAEKLMNEGGHTIFTGNPGVGKSTLLNAILQRTHYKAGCSLGVGLTKVLQTSLFGKLRVSDTPGLDDIHNKRQAAKEIAEAIRYGGNTLLFFVMTVEAGRVRPADIATAELIIESLQRENFEMDRKYSVIVNKVTPPLFAGGNDYKLSCIIGDLLEGSTKCRPYSILLHAMVPSAMDMDNVLLERPSLLMAKMAEVPSISIPQGTQVTIDTDKLNTEHIDELSKRIKELEEQLKDQARAPLQVPPVNVSHPSKDTSQVVAEIVQEFVKTLPSLANAAIFAAMGAGACNII